MNAPLAGKLAIGDRPPEGLGSWRMRRRFLFITLLFCMGCVAWILYKDMQSAVADTVSTMAFVTIMTSLGSYVFGAAWQDVSLGKGPRG